MSKVILSYMIQRGGSFTSRDVEQRECKNEQDAREQLGKAIDFLSRFDYRITWSEIRAVDEKERI